MKRPRYWLRLFFFFVVVLVLTQYVLLTWVVPRYLIQIVRSRFGNQLIVDHVEVSPLLVTRLQGIHVAGLQPQTAFSIQSVLIRPRWVWWSTRLIALESVKVEQPFLQIRRTSAGTWLWPKARPVEVVMPASGKPSWLSGWKISIGSVTFIDGAVEFMDENPPSGFHLLFDHLSSDAGPVTLPLTEDRSSFAIHGLMTNQKGDSASFYCSGWAGIVARDLQFSCQTDPLPLATLEPYFQQRSPVIRAYGVTARSASQWTAKDNHLEARIQFELNNLVEGDLSVRGRTIIDVKRLAASGEKSLSAELTFHGPLDQPGQWEGALTPGNPPVQKLVERLLERKIRGLRVSLAGHPVGIRLASATEATLQDMEAASKEISEALEILSAPLVYQIPVDVAPPFTAKQSPIIVMPSAKFVVAPTPASTLPEQPAVKVAPAPGGESQLPPSQ